MEKRLPLPVGTVLQGRYRILRQLGHGGFGAVYEAVDDALNLSFALKETFYAADEDLRQAFQREARMLASLAHEAFPRVTHYFTEGDGCFLVMELVEGEDLDKLLARRDQPLEEIQLLKWADQILDALEDLHAKGIIHRDIKPSNLKLTPKGKIKLLDFGIAKGALEGETTILTTVGSMAAATLQYAPLEQVLKASPQYQMMLSVVSSDKVMEVMRHGTDARSDLYALAATLYQLLTKTLPADAPTRALAIWSGKTDQLISAHDVNPHVTRAVSDVLLRALALDRAGRPATAAEMRRMLGAAVNPYAVILPPENARVAEKVEEPPTFFNPPPIRIEEPPPIANPSPQAVEKPPPIATSPPQVIEPFKKIEKNESPPLFGYSTPPAKPQNYFWVIAVLVGLFAFIGLSGIIGLVVYYKNNATSLNKGGVAADVNYELALTLAPRNSKISSLVFSPDGKSIACGGSEGDAVLIYETTIGAITEIIPSATLPAFSPDGKYLAYAAGGMSVKSIVLSQISSGNNFTVVSPKDIQYQSLKFSSSGGYLVYVEFDSVFKLAVPFQIPILGGQPAKIVGGATGVLLSPNNIWVLEAFEPNPGKLLLLDTEKEEVKQTLLGYGGNFDSVAFSSDNQLIAGGDGNILNIWELKPSVLPKTAGTAMFLQEAASNFSPTSPKLTLKGHTDSVTTVAFSPDGKLIASGSLDQTVRIWETANGNLKQTLTGHSGAIRALAFSSDGKMLVSGGDDKTVKLWRVKN